MKMFDVYPLQNIFIAKALGSNVWDKEGTKYLDMYGGHAVISIGHSHPKYVKAITQQLSEIGFYSNAVHLPLQEKLAQKLGMVSGKKDYQLFLCNSGAEANENALKLASFYNGRKKIICFTGAFHGRTSLAVSVTDNPAIIAPVNENENIIRLPFNNQAALEAAFKANDICAVITEGIQGVGGIVPAEISFLKAIRKLCNAYNAIYIADSVQCGYGRSGLFFSHDVAMVPADIYTMAKGMGNGFPIAGLAISNKFTAKHFSLGTTFGGNPLACAAALAVLEVLEEENLMQHAQKMGNYIKEELKKFTNIVAVRGAGLMIGIALPPELSGVKENLLYRHKIFTGAAKPNVIRLLPALNIKQTDIDIFLEALHKEIK